MATKQPMGLAGLFQDPNFLSFLAGTGARMDPEGVGGAVGKATTEWIQRQQMAEALEKQDVALERLIEAIGRDATRRTPGEEPLKLDEGKSLIPPIGDLNTVLERMQNRIRLYYGGLR